MAEWAVIGLMIGGTTMSVINQAKQAKEQDKLYKQRAAVAEGEAKAVTKASEHAEREKRIEARKHLAQQKVLFAKAGVKPKLGTPSKVMKETEEEYMRDAGYIQEGGAVEAARLRSEAGLQRQEGASAYRAGMWGAAETAMTGLGTTGMWAYKQGMFTKPKKQLTKKQFGKYWSNFQGNI